MNLGGWVKHFLIYGSGVVVMNLVPVLLIPIYTHGVTPAEYGVVELLNRSQELLLVILSFGLRSTLLTLYQMEVDAPERQSALYSTALQFLAITTFVLLALVATWSRPIAAGLFGDQGYWKYVVAMLAATYFETLFQISALFLQSNLKSVTYVSVFAGRAVFSVLLNLLCVSILKMGLWGILTAMLIHTVTASVLLCGYVLYRTGARLRMELLPEMLRFGMPLVPSAMMMFVLNNGDRYFLNAVSTRDEVGIYGLGYRLAQVASTVVLLPFGKIWSVVMVQIAKMEDGRAQLGKISSYLITALIFVSLGAALFSPYAIAFLATSKYYTAYRIVPPVALAYVLYSWTTVTDASFYVSKRTGPKPLILLISGVVVMTMYAVLIPRFHMVGAAWATLAGYVTFAAVSFWFAQRTYRIEYEWPRMLRVLGAGIVLYASVGWSVPTSILGVVLRLTALTAYVFWVCSDFVSTADERKLVLDNLRKGWNKLRGRDLASVIAV
jgi:O-antigen/teichoic acid export membrane protein